MLNFQLSGNNFFMNQYTVLKVPAFVHHDSVLNLQKNGALLNQGGSSAPSTPKFFALLGNIFFEIVKNYL